MLLSRQGVRKGFTLVELLVVIGIIALLIGLLAPALSKATRESRRLVCLGHVREIGNAILLYCNDYHGYFPTPAYPDGNLPPRYVYLPSDWIHWEKGRTLTDSAIAKYIARGSDVIQFTNLLRCPADHFEDRLEAPGYTKGQGPYLYSYAMNEWVSANTPPGISWRITQWKRQSARRVLVSECQDQRAVQKYGTTFRCYSFAMWGIAQVMSKRHGTVVFGSDVPGNPLMEHGSLTGTMASTYFMDGHVAPIEQDYSLDPQQMQSHPWDDMYGTFTITP